MIAATFGYSIRNMFVRRLQTAMTVFGIALVVFVFVATLMLENGLRYTLSNTGSPNNAIVLRLGAQNEIQSGITREHAGIILSQPEVAKDQQGQPIETSDILVLVSLRKRSDGQTSNVNVRGVGPKGQALREGIKLVEGRFPEVGTREVAIGRGINRKFSGTDLGGQLRLVGSDWKIVGIFDAGNSGYNSEIWGDVDVMMPAFKRDRFSSVTVRLADSVAFEALKQRLESERRLTVSVQRESEFYASQSKTLAAFIKYLGAFISVVFSLGAIIGAMITMYGAVASRIREIGVLRALGFSRTTVFLTFILECFWLSLIGGCLGILGASLLQWAELATTNFSTFSEIAFGFRLTLNIAFYGMVFAAVMGILGGAFPAFKAARMSIVPALRMR